MDFVFSLSEVVAGIVAVPAVFTAGFKVGQYFAQREVLHHQNFSNLTSAENASLKEENANFKVNQVKLLAEIARHEHSKRNKSKLYCLICKSHDLKLLRSERDRVIARNTITGETQTVPIRDPVHHFTCDNCGNVRTLLESELALIRAKEG